MNGRPIAEMVERLRSRKGLSIQENEAIADRLAELDAEHHKFAAAWNSKVGELADATAVRPWDQIAAVLRYDDGISTPTFGDLDEAAVAGDALAAEVARLTAENQRNSERLNELLEELEAENDRLTAVVAAVHAALDQWEDRLGGYAGCRECVADVAKAVGR